MPSFFDAGCVIFHGEQSTFGNSILTNDPLTDLAFLNAGMAGRVSEILLNDCTACSVVANHRGDGARVTAHDDRGVNFLDVSRST